MVTDNSVTRPLSVGAVIVNWRAAELTRTAVASVLAQTIPPDRVFVIDNGSADGSADLLRADPLFRSERVKLIESARNGGFGSGCNLGFREVLDHELAFAWLLNNDAIPASNCLARLLAAAVAAPAPVGLIGSLLVDPRGETEPHFGSWLNPLTLSCGAIVPGSPESHRFGWMTAASLLVASPALRTVGGFDEKFFMYWEDADLNVRISEAGFSIVGASDAVVSHHAGTSSANDTVRRYLWHFASQDRFIEKHFDRPLFARLRLRAKFLVKALLDRDHVRLGALLRAMARA